MKTTLLILLFSTSIFLKHDYSLLGTWTGTTSTGEQITFTFSKDSMVVWKVESHGHSVVMHAKYKVNEKTTPDEIDIFHFDKKQLKGSKFLGIFQFSDSITLKLMGKPSHGLIERRPSKFGKGTLTLKKQKS